MLLYRSFFNRYRSKLISDSFFNKKPELNFINLNYTCGSIEETNTWFHFFSQNGFIEFNVIFDNIGTYTWYIHELTFYNLIHHARAFNSFYYIKYIKKRVGLIFQKRFCVNFSVDLVSKDGIIPLNVSIQSTVPKLTSKHMRIIYVSLHDLTLFVQRFFNDLYKVSNLNCIVGNNVVSGSTNNFVRYNTMNLSNAVEFLQYYRLPINKCTIYISIVVRSLFYKKYLYIYNKIYYIFKKYI